MAQFLFSPNGAAYQPYFEFGQDLVCGEPSPDILLQVCNSIELSSILEDVPLAFRGTIEGIWK